MTYQIPFAISVALSTRVGNLLGATLDDAARVASNVGCVVSATVGILNGVVLFSARERWGRLFNNDPEVVKLVAQVMPYCALFQVFPLTSSLI
jgi:multidrug resistance protein, MATE family